MDSADRGHLAEAIGEVVELLDAVGQSYRKFFGEELRGAVESAYERMVSAMSHGKKQRAHNIHISCIGNVPTDGFSPNWTICRRETPVAGNFAKCEIRS